MNYNDASLVCALLGLLLLDELIMAIKKSEIENKHLFTGQNKSST